MRKSEIDKWREKQQLKVQSVELNSIDDIIRLMVDDRPDMSQRIVNPTQRAYILDDSRYKAYMGPAGCAKTTTGVVEVLLKALMMPGTKWFIARRDYNDLMDTTLRTATNVLDRLPAGTLIDRSKQPPMKWYLRPLTQMGEGASEVEPSEITFMGLSDNVGGYEFNGGFIDEADECEEHYVQQLKGRLRYKPFEGFPQENYHIGLAFNPPATNHWLYTACTGKDQEGNDITQPWLKLFKPSPTENTRNLPAGYYESMTASLPEDLRQRLVDGEWGSTFPGKPVIRQFSRSLHVRKDLVYKGGTIFRFADYGYRHPACLWAQIKKGGNLQVLREYWGTDVEGTAFAQLILQKTAEWFPDAIKFVDYGDPAVQQVKDTGQMLAILMKAGILVQYQKTPFDLSLQLLRKRFETLVEKEPAIVIDESCKMLIDALAGGYHYKDDGVTPHKGLYDHGVDALRYGVWNIFGSTLTSTTGLATSVAYWAKKS